MRRRGAVGSGDREDAFDLDGLARALGTPLGDAALFRQALTHSSYVNEHPGAGIASNERLEFLGDAVLQLIVSEHLYRHFESLDEGDLSKVRAAVVSSGTLSRLGGRLGLGRWLTLGRGEEASGGRERPSLLENAFEAVVGALYLDRGYPRTRRAVLRLLGPELDAAAAGGRRKDWKTELQELAQQQAGLPEYVLVGADGPDHAKVFEAAVLIAGREAGRGRGRTKKAAEQEAARQAYLRLKGAVKGCS